MDSLSKNHRVKIDKTTKIQSHILHISYISYLTDMPSFGENGYNGIMLKVRNTPIICVYLHFCAYANESHFMYKLSVKCRIEKSNLREKIMFACRCVDG